MALDAISNNIRENPIRYNFLTVTALTAIVLGILGLMKVQPFHQMGTIGSISLMAAPFIVFIALLLCLDKDSSSDMYALQNDKSVKEPVKTEAPLIAVQEPEYERVLNWEYVNGRLGVRYVSLPTSGGGYYAPDGNSYIFEEGDYFVYRNAGSEVNRLEYHNGSLHFGKGEKPTFSKCRNRIVRNKANGDIFRWHCYMG